MAAVSVVSAAESDALSTALLVEGFAGLEKLRRDARLLVLKGKEVRTRGFEIWKPEN